MHHSAAALSLIKIIVVLLRYVVTEKTEKNLVKEENSILVALQAWEQERMFANITSTTTLEESNFSH